MTTTKLVHRRTLLTVGAGLGAACVACSRDDARPDRMRGFVEPLHPAVPARASGAWTDDVQVTAVEDLMREHGLVQRILAVYETAADRIDARDVPPRSVIVDAARIVREFVQDYHEKLEEEYVFPRFEQAGRLVDVVTTLRLQHLRGHALTEEIRMQASAGPLGEAGDDARLTTALRAYVRMYRPHAAREDTVLFPLLREIVKGPEYRELGEIFEEREHELFGPHSFERIVDRVAALERAFDIDDLAAYTA